MSIRTEIIRCSDDDLISISNKGIVKRAYKDLEGGLGCEIVDDSDVDSIQVNCGEEKVTIVYPFTDSKCSCPSRTICRHVMSAILYVKMNSSVAQEQIEQNSAGAQEQNCDGVQEKNAPKKNEDSEENEVTSYQDVYQDEMRTLLKETSIEELQLQIGKLKAYLEELLLVGLSRTSRDSIDTLDRLAIVCHNCGLADFENRCKSLRSGYSKYFAHSARFSQVNHLQKIFEFIDLLDEMNASVENKDYETFEKLAGTFRASYKECDDLELYGISKEHIKTANGYEGDVTYFIEAKTKKWYTYSELRPVNLEVNSKKKVFLAEKSLWGLNIRANELYQFHFQLENPKCDEKNHLSSTSKSKAVSLEKSLLSKELVEPYYFEDFSCLFKDYLNSEERLYFIAPGEIATPFFNETAQKLQAYLLDATGRKILLEIKYSKEEEATIRYLEKLDTTKEYCFFGRVYASGDILCLQPIAMYNKETMFGA